MTKWFSLTALAFGFAVTLSANQGLGSIEDFVEREMPNSGVPGLAYGIVTNGNAIVARARGVSNVDTGTVVTEDTPFLTGSVSKSFTALAIMQLMEAEKIELDAPVSDYLPVFAERPAGGVTIRQLLSHTSGFSTFQGNASHKDRTDDGDILAYQAAQIAQEEPAYSPGTRWEYSNHNYKVLGRVIEVVSGQDFATYIESRIMEPAEMRDSFVSDGTINGDMATGHRPWFGTKKAMTFNPSGPGSAPQGGIVASAADLARYLQLMMNEKDDILSAAGKQAMMQPASELSPYYGFGWFLDEEKGTVFHSGSSPGFEALATMKPAEKKAAIVLVNAGSGTGFGETIQLRNGITARALGLAYHGETSRTWQKALFISLALLPIIYLLSMVWAYRYRAALRAKTGPFGLFSLWFPLVTTVAAAIFILVAVPRIFGASLATIGLFQPDVGLLLIATATMGVLWAVFRLILAYFGKAAPEQV
ncbi:serine hydrolase domain-containing protein [Parerythrobacter jejuensis]|uniref:serine hydrolase domain-containing protein n=1 Tax=Parerythrobacter jejuensis TaxID=795812 RepID=UPI0018F8CA14|nr:serine hydrolase domain-containing protein [Parerythrobacter jejuensis]